MGSKPQDSMGGTLGAAPPANPGPSMGQPSPMPQPSGMPQAPPQMPMRPAMGAPPQQNPGLQMIMQALQASGQNDPRVAALTQSPEMQMIMRMQQQGGGSHIVDMLRGLGGGLGGIPGSQVG